MPSGSCSVPTRRIRRRTIEPGLAEVCDALANLLLKRGRSLAALAFAHSSLAQKRKLGDRYGEAITLGTIGRAYLLQARHDEAAEAFAQDLAIARELGDERGVGIMLNSLGEVALLRKDLGTAARHYQDNLSADRGPYNAIHAELGLTRVHLAAGQLDAAEAACGRMAKLLEANPKIHGLAEALTGLRGAIAWRRGDLDAGKRLLTDAIEGLDRRNQPLDAVPLLYELRDLRQARGDTAQVVEAITRASTSLPTAAANRASRMSRNGSAKWTCRG